MSLIIDQAPYDVPILFRANIKQRPLKVAMDNIYIMCVQGRHSYRFHDEKSGDEYEFNLGQIITDLASIPKIPFVYEKLKLKCPLSSLPHDGMFVCSTTDDHGGCWWSLNGEVQNRRFPRSLANEFYEALSIYYGMSNATAKAEYLALEIGSSSTYNSHEEVQHV